jgi:hypothetical protein
MLHPATLDQLVDRLVAKGPVLAEAPVAGPVRLRTVPAEPARLTGLADALDDAVELFGLGSWGEEATR